MVRHWHSPAAGTRDDLDDPAIVDHTQPYAPGTHAVCHYCGYRIVFVEGYDFRRDYWRSVGRSPLRSRREGEAHA